MEYHSLLSIHFWAFFLLFFIAVFFSFYLPGSVIVKHIHLPTKSSCIIAVVVGLVMWGIQGYIFGYLGTRWLTYIYLIVFAYLAIKNRTIFQELYFNEIKKTLLSHKLVVALIIVGVFVQIVPVFGSGLLYKEGVKFIGVNAYDGVMHLAYIQSIANAFPPIEPGAYPNNITNYHYWTDLVLADLARVWNLPVVNLFFQYFPFFISLITGLVAVVLVRVWRGPETMTPWFLFLLFFAGDAAYIFMLILHGSFGFYTPAIDNGATQFLNLPHAVAKPIFMAGLIFLHYWIKDRNKYAGVLSMVLFAALFGFKVYFGIYIAIGLALLFIAEFILYCSKLLKKKIFLTGIKNVLVENSFLFILGVVFLLVAASIYLPPNKNAGGLFFAPLEWPKIFLNEYNINFREWWLRRQVYVVHNREFYLFIFDAVAIAITLISVYGTRLLGFVPTKSEWRWLGYQKVLLFFPGLLLFQFLGFFTLQNSGGFNVFNFFAVSAFILSFLSAFILAQIGKSKHLVVKIGLALFIILTIPRVIYEIHYYTDTKNLQNTTNLVPNSELSALAYLRNNASTDGMVQSHPSNPFDRRSSYVSFFSNRFTYLTGVDMQETHNQKLDDRKAEIKAMFSKETEDDFVSEMRKKHIYYIYLHKNKDESLRFDISNRYVDIPFENDTIRILSLKEQYRGE